MFISMDRDLNAAMNILGLLQSLRKSKGSTNLQDGRAHTRHVSSLCSCSVEGLSLLPSSLRCKNFLNHLKLLTYKLSSTHGDNNRSIITMSYLTRSYLIPRPIPITSTGSSGRCFRSFYHNAKVEDVLGQDKICLTSYPVQSSFLVLAQTN